MRKYLFALIVLSLPCLIHAERANRGFNPAAITVAAAASSETLFTTFVASDTFTDTDGVNLTEHTPEIGTSWSTATAAGYAMTVATNKIGAASASGYTAFYTGVATTNANYDVRGKVTAASANTSPFVMGRCSTTQRTGYVFYWQNGQYHLSKWVNGTFTENIGTAYTASAPSDTLIALHMNGTTIQGWLSGSLIIETTDATISGAGRGAVGAYYADSGTRIDEWAVLE